MITPGEVREYLLMTDEAMGNAVEQLNFSPAQTSAAESSTPPAAVQPDSEKCIHSQPDDAHNEHTVDTPSHKGNVYQ